MYIYISSGGQLHMKIKFFPVGTLFALILFILPVVMLYMQIKVL